MQNIVRINYKNYPKQLICTNMNYKNRNKNTSTEKISLKYQLKKNKVRLNNS